MRSINELEELAKLYKEGSISKEEFESLKAEIINNTSERKQKNSIYQSADDRSEGTVNQLSESEKSDDNSVHSTGRYIGQKIGLLYWKYPKIILGGVVIMVLIVIGQNYKQYSHLKQREQTKIVETNTASDNSNNNNSINSNANETYEEKMKRVVKDNISNRTFISEEHGFYTAIRFEPVDEQAFGAMILSQNYCNYSFTYDINENRIDAKFLTSDCGGSSRNAVFYYIEKNDWITTNIEGQMFIFK